MKTKKFVYELTKSQRVLAVVHTCFMGVCPVAGEVRDRWRARAESDRCLACFLGPPGFWTWSHSLGSYLDPTKSALVSAPPQSSLDEPNLQSLSPRWIVCWFRMWNTCVLEKQVNIQDTRTNVWNLTKTEKCKEKCTSCLAVIENVRGGLMES